MIAGVGFYQHLLLYIQSHYQLEMQDCIDWTHVTDPLIGIYMSSVLLNKINNLIALVFKRPLLETCFPHKKSELQTRAGLPVCEREGTLENGLG